MKHKAIKRMVGPGEYFDDEESLRAYSYDASPLEEQPLVVVRPRHIEEVRRILNHANQYHLPVVPRGSGTGLRGGAIKKGAIILDMRGFTKVERLDKQRLTIDVGAGVTIGKLRKVLEKLGYYFPLLPSNDAATVGGLASQNHVTEESMLFGDWLDLVEWVECFDGLGRFQTLKGKDVAKVIGLEGTTGILISLRLKLFPGKQRRTLDIIEVENPSEALSLAEQAMQKKGMLLAEYLDGTCSGLLGLEKERHLLIAYANDAGSYKDASKVTEILEKRKRLPQLLWNEGYRFEREATLEEEQIERFVARCETAAVPCYGHLGMGLMIAALEKEEQVETFGNAIVSLGGIPAGKHGFGRVASDYVPQELKKRVGRLKEERDYNMILNPGVFI